MDEKTEVIRGTICFAMSLNFTPDQVAELLINLDKETVQSLANLFIGNADDRVIRKIGGSLTRKQAL